MKVPRFDFLKSMTMRQKVKIGLLGIMVIAVFGTLIILRFTGHLGIRADENPCNGNPSKVCNQATATYGSTSVSSNWSEINILSTVTGVVKNVSNGAFPNVTVKLCKWATDFWGGCSTVGTDKTTDANGAYSFANFLPEGAYALTYLASGQQNPSLESQYLYTHNLYLKSNTTNDAGNYILNTDPVVLGGRIIYDDWNRSSETPRTVSGASCNIKDGETVVLTKTTDEDGVFRAYSADNLVNGKEYNIVCTKTGYRQSNPYGGSDIPKITLNADYSQNNAIVSMLDNAIASPATLNITLKNSSGATINPCVNCWATIMRTSTKHSITRSVANSSNWTFSDLPDGAYHISVVGPGYREGSADATLIAGQTTSKDITLPGSAIIQGVVKAADNNGPVDSTVELLSSDGATVLQTTETFYYCHPDNDNETCYSFAGNIPAGNYKVKAVPTSSDQASMYISNAEDVTVTDGQTVTHNLVLPRNGGGAAISSVESLPIIQTPGYQATTNTAGITTISGDVSITDPASVDQKSLDKIQVSLTCPDNKPVDIESRYSVDLKHKKINYSIHSSKMVDKNCGIVAKQNDKVIGESKVNLTQQAGPISETNLAKKSWWQRMVNYLKKHFSRNR